MNIPKEIIEKAIEGQWQPLPPEEISTWRIKNGVHFVFYWKTDWYSEFTPQEIALDASFWVALGKSLGWEAKPIFFRADSNEKYTQAGVNAHRFYDLVLEGKPTDEFWKELLSVKESK